MRRTLALLTSVAAVALSHTAEACFSRKPTAPALIRAVPISATTWNLYAPGYRTLSLGTGTHCAVGFATRLTGPILAVNETRVYAAANAATLPGIRFQGNTTTRNSLASLRPALRWTGFFATTTASIPAGIDTILCFNVTTKQGTTFAQLSAQLSGAVIATDEATSTGQAKKQARLLVHTIKTVAGDDQARNAKLFYNARHTTLTTRQTTTLDDTIYAMQDRLSQNSQAQATGWLITLQDQNASTAEEAKVSFVRYRGSSGLPDVRASGTVTRVTYRLFGVGSGIVATHWTLTVATRIPIPHALGIALDLPKAHPWPADVLTVHTQLGDRTRLTPALRKQWTYWLRSGAAANYRVAGTTLRCSGLYDSPVCQIVAQSSAYGQREILQGPEALHIDPARGDRLGFRIVSERHRLGTFAVLLLASDYSPIPVPTPVGDFLVLPPALQLTFAMPASGDLTTPFFTIPRKTQLAAQAAMLDFSTLTVALSDASKLIAQ